MAARTYRGVGDIARLIYENVETVNPIVSAVIRNIEEPVNGTPMVTVERSGYFRRAIFAPDADPVVDGGVFITRFSGSTVSPLFVIGTNYQATLAPDYQQSPVLLTETDPGEDGIYGTWDDVHYLMRDDDGYYLRDA